VGLLQLLFWYKLLSAIAIFFLELSRFLENLLCRFFRGALITIFFALPVL
jgi:hypothetical protein